jgi:hypothetical protein
MVSVIGSMENAKGVSDTGLQGHLLWQKAGSVGFSHFSFTFFLKLLQTSSLHNDRTIEQHCFPS